MNEVLRDLVTLAFITSHLFSTGRYHAAEITEILHLIEILEDIHTKLQGMITPPHLATTIF